MPNGIETLLGAGLGAFGGTILGFMVRPLDGQPQVQVIQPIYPDYKQIEQQKPYFYETITLDMATSRSGVPFPKQVDHIYIVNKEASVPCNIQLNEPEYTPMDLRDYEWLSGPIWRFFISNTVGTGSIELILTRGGLLQFTRSTEYPLSALSKIAPIAKATIFNTALPAADTDLLASNITPTNSPSWLRIYATIGIAGKLYLRRTVGGVTVSEDLNSGANLTANAAHCFGPIEWRAGDSLNLRYSATGANILVLRINEIGAAE